MLAGLNELIKSDSESQELFQSFNNEFKTKEEALAKLAFKRAKVIALILSGTSVLAILSFVYAFTITIKSESEKVKFDTQIQTLEMRIESCSNN